MFYHTHISFISYLYTQNYEFILNALLEYNKLQLCTLYFSLPKMLYVTGYWKTDHNVTLGQLHFIGPANSHTHALSMH